MNEITVRQVNNGFILMFEVEEEQQFYAFQSCLELLLFLEEHFEFKRLYPIRSDEQ